MREITCRGMSCSVLFCQWQHCPGTGSDSGSKTCPYIYPFFLHHIPAIKPISHSVGNGEKRPRKTLELDTIEVCALWQQMNDNQPENWVQPKEKKRGDLCVCVCRVFGHSMSKVLSGFNSCMLSMLLLLVNLNEFFTKCHNAPQKLRIRRVLQSKFQWQNL